MVVCFYIHGRSPSARLFGPPTLFIKDPAEPKLSPNLGASAPQSPRKKVSSAVKARSPFKKRIVWCVWACKVPPTTGRGGRGAQSANALCHLSRMLTPASRGG